MFFRLFLATAVVLVLVSGVCVSAGVGRGNTPAPSPAPTSPPELGDPLYPNIVEKIPHHLGIQNDHQREWLRFTTTHINLGPGELQIYGAGTPQPCVIDGESYEQCTYAKQHILDANRNIVLEHDAGVSLFHPAHNHWHQAAVAAFELLRADPVTGDMVPADQGGRASQGTKITFCFVDVVFTGVTGREKKALPRRYWSCGSGDLQGLSVGWGDAYHHSLPLQEIEVTGLPEGDYYLTHLVDPENHWLEGPDGEDDNFAWVKFHLSRSGSAQGNAGITVLDHSPCEGAACPEGSNV